MTIALKNLASLENIKSVIERLTEYTRKNAYEAGMLTPDDDWFFDAQIKKYDPNSPEQLLNAAVTMAEYKDNTESNRRIANYLGANRIVLNALDNFYRACVTQEPSERFESFLREGLDSKEKQEDFLKSMEAAMDKMIINIVQTMHPTIYHTKFGRDCETELTGILEQISEHIDDKRTTDELLIQAEEGIAKLISGIAKDGKQITPNKRVTVAEENELDRENHEIMKKNFNSVIDDFNAAVQKAAGRLHGEQLDSLAERLKAIQIKKEQVEYRTWAYAADADGREKATSIELYRGIYHQVKEGDTEYKSRKRDIRENARDHLNTVSCLLQRAATDNKELTAYLEKSGVSGKKLLQDIDTTQQAAILRELVASDNYFTPEFREDMKAIRDGAIAFNKMFAAKYPEFLEQNNLPPTTEIDDLRKIKGDIKSSKEPRNKLYELCNFIAKQKVDVGSEKDVDFRLDYNSLTYERDEFQRHSRLFEETSIRDKNTKELREIDVPERRKFLDVIKRLQILDHATGMFGDKVADRYQIANFEGPANFYSAMLLFKENGIIEVEDGKIAARTGTAGKVVSPKLSIQPLLETAEDQAHAPEMFQKLLEDPLVVSYYKAIGGKADIMFGYSDGAKSAGNFASEWSIRQNASELQKVFAGHGIELHVFHGRGRGDSRGGQFDAGQDQRMMDPNLAATMIFDETQQSDLPMAGAISQKFGKDMCASTLTGIITASREAMADKKDSKYHEYDSIIDGIAEASAESYRKLVFDRKETRALLATIHDNPYKSSRAAVRGAAPASLDDIRAITVEYGFNMVDAPLHYIGLKAALEELSKAPGGMEKLRNIYKSHPFFCGMMDKTAQGLIDYDPNVFRQYAKVAGVSEWAEECIKELNGMRDLVQQVREHKEPQNKTQAQNMETRIASIIERGSNSPAAKSIDMAELLESNLLREQELALDKNAHAFVLARTMEDGKITEAKPDRNPLKPSNPDEAGIMYLATFVTQASLPSKMQHPPAETRGKVDGFAMTV